MIHSTTNSRISRNNGDNTRSGTILTRKLIAYLIVSMLITNKDILVFSFQTSSTLFPPSSSSNHHNFFRSTTRQHISNIRSSTSLYNHDGYRRHSSSILTLFGEGNDTTPTLKEQRRKKSQFHYDERVAVAADCQSLLSSSLFSTPKKQRQEIIREWGGEIVSFLVYLIRQIQHKSDFLRQFLQRRKAIVALIITATLFEPFPRIANAATSYNDPFFPSTGTCSITIQNEQRPMVYSNNNINDVGTRVAASSVVDGVVGTGDIGVGMVSIHHHNHHDNTNYIDNPISNSKEINTITVKHQRNTANIGASTEVVGFALGSGTVIAASRRRRKTEKKENIKSKKGKKNTKKEGRQKSINTRGKESIEEFRRNLIMNHVAEEKRKHQTTNEEKHKYQTTTSNNIVDSATAYTDPIMIIDSDKSKKNDDIKSKSVTDTFFSNFEQKEREFLAMMANNNEILLEQHQQDFTADDRREKSDIELSNSDDNGQQDSLEFLFSSHSDINTTGSTSNTAENILLDAATTVMNTRSSPLSPINHSKLHSAKHNIDAKNTIMMIENQYSSTATIVENPKKSKASSLIKVIEEIQPTTAVDHDVSFDSPIAFEKIFNDNNMNNNNELIQLPTSSMTIGDTTNIISEYNGNNSDDKKIFDERKKTNNNINNDGHDASVSTDTRTQSRIDSMNDNDDINTSYHNLLKTKSEQDSLPPKLLNDFENIYKGIFPPSPAPKSIEGSRVTVEMVEKDNSIISDDDYFMNLFTEKVKEKKREMIESSSTPSSLPNGGESVVSKDKFALKEKKKKQQKDLIENQLKIVSEHATTHNNDDSKTDYNISAIKEFIEISSTIKEAKNIISPETQQHIEQKINSEEKYEEEIMRNEIIPQKTKQRYLLEAHRKLEQQMRLNITYDEESKLNRIESMNQELKQKSLLKANLEIEQRMRSKRAREEEIELDRIVSIVKETNQRALLKNQLQIKQRTRSERARIKEIEHYRIKSRIKERKQRSLLEAKLKIKQLVRLERFREEEVEQSRILSIAKETKQRSLLETQLQIEQQIRLERAHKEETERNRIAAIAKETNQRSLLETQLQINKKIHSERSRKEEIQRNKNISIMNEMKQRILLETKLKVERKMRAERDYNNRIEYEKSASTVRERKQRLLLETQLQIEQRIRLCRARVEKNRIKETNQRNLLEAKLQIDQQLSLEKARTEESRRNQVASIVRETKQRALLESQLQIEQKMRSKKDEEDTMNHLKVVPVIKDIKQMSLLETQLQTKQQISFERLRKKVSTSKEKSQRLLLERQLQIEQQIRSDRADEEEAEMNRIKSFTKERNQRSLLENQLRIGQRVRSEKTSEEQIELRRISSIAKETNQRSLLEARIQNEQQARLDRAREYEINLRRIASITKETNQRLLLQNQLNIVQQMRSERALAEELELSRAASFTQEKNQRSLLETQLQLEQQKRSQKARQDEIERQRTATMTKERNQRSLLESRLQIEQYLRLETVRKEEIERIRHAYIIKEMNQRSLLENHLLIKQKIRLEKAHKEERVASIIKEKNQRMLLETQLQIEQRRRLERARKKEIEFKKILSTIKEQRSLLKKQLQINQQIRLDRSRKEEIERIKIVSIAKEENQRSLPKSKLQITQQIHLKTRKEYIERQLVLSAIKETKERDLHESIGQQINQNPFPTQDIDEVVARAENAPVLNNDQTEHKENLSSSLSKNPRMTSLKKDRSIVSQIAQEIRNSVLKETRQRALLETRIKIDQRSRYINVTNLRKNAKRSKKRPRAEFDFPPRTLLHLNQKNDAKEVRFFKEKYNNGKQKAISKRSKTTEIIISNNETQNNRIRMNESSGSRIDINSIKQDYTTNTESGNQRKIKKKNMENKLDLEPKDKLLMMKVQMDLQMAKNMYHPKSDIEQIYPKRNEKLSRLDQKKGLKQKTKPTKTQKTTIGYTTSYLGVLNNPRSKGCRVYDLSSKTGVGPVLINEKVNRMANIKYTKGTAIPRSIESLKRKTYPDQDLNNHGSYMTSLNHRRQNSYFYRKPVAPSQAKKKGGDQTKKIKAQSNDYEQNKLEKIKKTDNNTAEENSSLLNEYNKEEKTMEEKIHRPSIKKKNMLYGDINNINPFDFRY